MQNELFMSNIEKCLAVSIITKGLPLSEMIAQYLLHQSAFFLSLHTPAVGESETSVT